MKNQVFRLVMSTCVIAAGFGCSNGVALPPPTAPDLVSSSPTTISTDTTAAPTSPTTSAPAAASAQQLAYLPDLQPIFNADCTPCHTGGRPAGNYSMTSYNSIMAAVRAGSASSPLVIVTRPSGSMYRFFTGDRATKSAMVNQWVVSNGAAQTR